MTKSYDYWELQERFVCAEWSYDRACSDRRLDLWVGEDNHEVRLALIAFSERTNKRLMQMAIRNMRALGLGVVTFVVRGRGRYALHSGANVQMMNWTRRGGK